MSESLGRARALALLVLLSAALAVRLLYGAWGAHSQRFWDEGYALQNVESILVDRTLEPRISYYPSPLFNLPAAVAVGVADRVHEALGGDAGRVYEGGVFGPAGYRIVRWLQAIFGVVAVWLVLRIGRRLFAPAVGWLAAIAVAFSPWCIHSSGTFKPDGFLLMAVLAGFDLGLSCVRTPTVARALAAGAGIALATSAKLTGALVAVPLAIGLVWPGRRGEDGWARGEWRALVIAGISSLGFFFATNPYGWWYPRWVASLKDDYAMRAGWESASKLEIPGRTIRLIIEPEALGLLFGVAALVGLAGLTVRVTVRIAARVVRREGEVPRELAMFVAFPWIYTIAYATQTSYFKPNNLLPVVAFAAIAGAWLITTATRWIHRPRLAPVGWLAMTALLAAPGLRYVYTSLVPTAYDAARLVNRPRPHGLVPQTILVEEGALGGGWAWEGYRSLGRSDVAETVVPDLTKLPVAWASGVDLLILPARREGRIAASPLATLLEDARPTAVERHGAEWPSVRGPNVVLWRRAWRPRRPVREAGVEICGGRPACRRLAPEGTIRAGMSTSVQVFLPRSLLPEEGEPAWLEVSGDRYPLYASSEPIRHGAGSGVTFVSPRFQWPGDAVELHLARPPSPGAKPALAARIYRWRSVDRTVE